MFMSLTHPSSKSIGSARCTVFTKSLTKKHRNIKSATFRNAPRRQDFADSLWMMYEHGGDFLDASFIANTKMFHFARALVEHVVNVVLSPNFHEGEM